MAAHVIVADGTVQEAAVVPDHQVAGAPSMGIDEARLGRVGEGGVVFGVAGGELASGPGCDD